MKRTAKTKKKARKPRKWPVGKPQVEEAARYLSELAPQFRALVEKMDEEAFAGEIIWDGSGAVMKHLEAAKDWIDRAKSKYEKFQMRNGK